MSFALVPRAAPCASTAASLAGFWRESEGRSDALEGVLSPRLDPVELIRNYMLDVMMKRVGDSFSPGRVFAWVLDMKHLFENSPRRTDILLDKLANDQFTMRLALDEQARASLDRTTGRLSRAMVSSALLIGGGYVLGSLLRRGKV